jgi:hypothetical protein
LENNSGAMYFKEPAPIFEISKLDASPEQYLNIYTPAIPKSTILTIF